MTVAMAGNNRLGGQDFNDRVQNHLMQVIYRSIYYSLLCSRDSDSFKLKYIRHFMCKKLLILGNV